MSDPIEQLERLLEAAEQLDIELRREPMTGNGGGLCRINGRYVLFVDTLADPATRLERSLEALAGAPDIDGIYLTPDLRERLEAARQAGG
ncbi:MAG: hypothetical protein ACE5GE_15800 [Phycisphaerae bacterium]